MQSIQHNWQSAKIKNQTGEIRRTIEGLHTPAPYSFAVLGHADKIERMRIEYR